MIVVLGSINLDLIAKAKRLPAVGETVLGSEFLSTAGGKGANQALAVRRAGSAVKLAGAVGDDAFAGPATRLLRDAGIDLSGVQVRPGATGVALILVGADGSNMITVIPAANGTVTAADAENVVAAMDHGDILMLQLEIPLPAVEAALAASRKKLLKSVLNVAPFAPDSRSLARMADVVIANEVEFDGLAGRAVGGGAEREDALAWMHADCGATVIVTLGADGAVAMGQGTLHKARSLPIVPVDTVGAGDTFCGYFTASLDQGLDLGRALARAATAGSLACLARGAQASIPLAGDVDRQLSGAPNHA